MAESSRVRAFMGLSFDGFIAGPDNDISWLGQSFAREGDLPADAGAIEFEGFMAEIGAMVMGRTTYDVVEGIGQWPYGDTPVLVATTRPLDSAQASVQAVQGEITEIVARAKALAGDRDVYLDGGALIRQALDAGLVDEIVASFVPVLLGSGVRLFEGSSSRVSLQFTAHHSMAQGMLQVRAKVHYA